MNRATRTIPAGLVVVLAALFGCTTPVEHGTPMTPQQISSDLVGKSWSGTLYNGSPTTQVVDADGTIRIEGGLNDSGRWRMSENGYCVTWNRMRHGVETCYVVERTPSGHYVVNRANGGQLVMTVTSVQ
jgi:hypothetical protein